MRSGNGMGPRRSRRSAPLQRRNLQVPCSELRLSDLDPRGALNRCRRSLGLKKEEMHVPGTQSRYGLAGLFRFKTMPLIYRIGTNSTVVKET